MQVRAIRALIGALAALILAGHAGADPLATMPPLAPGPYAVGCSNIEQDFSRVGAGETPAMYWEGIPAGGRSRYVSDLLASPADVPSFALRVPDDAELFGPLRNQTLQQVLLVCYPTPAANPNTDYVLEGGGVVPHMQRGGAAPLFANPEARYPVLLFSHGLGGSPLSGDYLDAMRVLAAQGYVVVAPFHADARVVDFRIEDLNDLLAAILNFPRYIAMQSLRPLALSGAIDWILTNPAFASHVDPQRVVGFGASLGGESLMLLGGAKLTTTVGQASKQVIVDPRFKAAVGYVPYFGQEPLPAFGRDQAGLDGVALPYLAIAGTADTTAPLSATEAGMRRLTQSHTLVTLQGTGHYFDRGAKSDIFTWTLVFLAAQLGDPGARAQLQRLTSVEGGGDDRLQLDYTAPLPAAADERMAVEYYNARLDHYFVTADPAETAMLDQGVIVPGWTRTGFLFKTWAPDAAAGLPVCRFFGTPGLGPDSHFFTVDAAECAKVKANPFWTFEGLAFRVEPSGVGTCPANRMVVTRMYNNGKGGQANHRYVTSYSENYAMRGEGWIEEGPVFCTPP